MDTAPEVTTALSNASERVLGYEDRLASACTSVLAKAGKIAAANFEERAQATLVAAGEGGWEPPHADELIDVDAVVSELRTKSDPVRRAAIAAYGGALAGTEANWDVSNPLVGGVLAGAAQHVTSIADTTRINLMRIIDASYEEGLSIEDTAKAIRVGMADASKVRGRLIARTEIAAVTNGGSLAASKMLAETSGEPLYKRWLTAPGAHYPRHEDYEELDGQTVGLDDAFDVGGVALQFPGDPDGPPEEICNCRCTLLYVGSPDEGQESESADLTEPADADPESALVAEADEVSAAPGPGGLVETIVERASLPPEVALPPEGQLGRMGADKLWSAWANLGRAKNAVRRELDVPRADRLSSLLWEKGAGRLPARTVRLEEVAGDQQIHTHYSDGHQSVADIAENAVKHGETQVVISDHSHLLTADEIDAQHAEIDALNKKYEGKLKILKGVEANILQDGSLDLAEAELARFDVVNAAIHAPSNPYPEAVIAPPGTSSAVTPGDASLFGTRMRTLMGADDPYLFDPESVAELIPVEQRAVWEQLQRDLLIWDTASWEERELAALLGRDWYRRLDFAANAMKRLPEAEGANPVLWRGVKGMTFKEGEELILPLSDFAADSATAFDYGETVLKLSRGSAALPANLIDLDPAPFRRYLAGGRFRVSGVSKTVVDGGVKNVIELEQLPDVPRPPAALPVEQVYIKVNDIGAFEYEADAWSANITGAQARAIEDYRLGHTQDPAVVRQVNEAIKTTPGTDDNYVAWRGTRQNTTDADFTEKRPVSASLSRTAAEPYADPTGRGGTDGLSKILVPVGTKALYVSGESELILPPGTVFRFVGRDAENIAVYRADAPATYLADWADDRVRDINTDRLLGALDNPKLTVLVHPHSVKADWDAVAEKAAEKGVALEVNGRDLLRNQTEGEAAEMIAAAQRHGARLAFGSDGHTTEDMVDLVYAIRFAAKHGVTRSDLAAIARRGGTLEDPSTSIPARLNTNTDGSGRLGGGMNEVWKIRADDGELYVVKPDPDWKALGARHGFDTNDPLRANVSLGAELERERAAYVVSRLFNDVGGDKFHVNVPPYRIGELTRTGKTVKAGIAEYVRNGTEARSVGFVPSSWRQVADPEQVRSAALFDAVIGNTDRHAGNFLLDLGKADPMRSTLDKTPSTMWLIDHGLSFPSGPGEYFGQNTQIVDLAANTDAALSAAEIQFLRELRDRLDEIYPELNSLLGSDEVADMRDRIEWMIRDHSFESAVINQRVDLDA